MQHNFIKFLMVKGCLFGVLEVLFVEKEIKHINFSLFYYLTQPFNCLSKVVVCIVRVFSIHLFNWDAFDADPTFLEIVKDLLFSYEILSAYTFVDIGSFFFG